MRKQKPIVKRDAYMKFYNVARSLYLKRDVSGNVLGARLLQTRDGANWRHDEIPGNTIL